MSCLNSTQVSSGEQQVSAGDQQVSAGEQQVSAEANRPESYTSVHLSSDVNTSVHLPSDVTSELHWAGRQGRSAHTQAAVNRINELHH